MPAKVAVVDKKFAEQVKPVAVSDSLRFVKLVAYEPNDLKYEVSSEKGGVVVSPKSIIRVGRLISTELRLLTAGQTIFYVL